MSFTAILCLVSSHLLSSHFAHVLHLLYSFCCLALPLLLLLAIAWCTVHVICTSSVRHVLTCSVLACSVLACDTRQHLACQNMLVLQQTLFSCPICIAGNQGPSVSDVKDFGGVKLPRRRLWSFWVRGNRVIGFCSST